MNTKTAGETIEAKVKEFTKTYYNLVDRGFKEATAHSFVVGRATLQLFIWESIIADLENDLSD